jgi:hypothetical protein
MKRHEAVWLVVSLCENRYASMFCLESLLRYCVYDDDGVVKTNRN